MRFGRQGIPVEVHTEGIDAARMRRVLGKVAKSHFESWGLALPENLTIVVRYSLPSEEGPLASQWTKLTLREGRQRRRRHEIALAIDHGNDYLLHDEELGAVLANELHRFCREEFGVSTEYVRTAAPRLPTPVQTVVAEPLDAVVTLAAPGG